jgi:catechol 2,3-dioxygenase-like lactoylglutathione lyase family enzyme
MPDPNFLVLYVDDPAASAAFYRDLLGREPVEASPTFVMFALDGGPMLGLWSRRTVEPAAAAGGGGAELAVAVADGAVDATFADWTGRGITIVQRPTTMDFGRTFVALDPDGHRLRVFAPADARQPTA